MPAPINKPVDAAMLAACLLAGGVIYGLLVVGAYLSQASIIFRNGGLTANPPTAFPIEQVTFETADGLRLNGWWLAGPAQAPTVLYFQGSRYGPGDYHRRLRTLTQLEVQALLFDYRGCGQSPGRIREEADIYRDGLAAWDYVRRARAVAPRDLFLWGRSLGGAVAVEVARRRPVGGLILESTFKSLADMGARHYGWLPTRHLLRFRFNNGEKIAQVRAPLIILHSPADRYIPWEQAETLFRQASRPKALVRTFGSHLDLFETSDEHFQAFRCQWLRLMATPDRHRQTPDQRRPGGASAAW
jgi:alpha-beta hydrolase superfamily lysophospholipase